MADVGGWGGGQTCALLSALLRTSFYAVVPNHIHSCAGSVTPVALVEPVQKVAFHT